MMRKTLLFIGILSCVLYAPLSVEAQRITATGQSIESWNTSLNLNSSSTMDINIGNGDIFVSNVAGNVGIGTNNPTYKLSINGIVNASAFYIAGQPYVNSQWISSSTSIYYTVGNVGIGTTSPGYIFDVIGNTRFTQPVLVGTPTAPDHVATKNYVDSAISSGMTGTIGYLPKFTNTNTIGNSVMFETGGNIGIGTTSPGEKLDVNGNIYLGNQKTVYFRRADGSRVYQVGYYTDDAFYVGASPASGPTAGTTMYVRAGSSALHIGRNSGNVITINTSDNVGIATTAPSYKLDVVGTSQFSQPILTATPTGSSHAATKGYVDSVAGSGLVGGGTANYITKWTASNTVSNSIIFDNGTNVGIGTTAPEYLLEIIKSGNSILNIKNSDGLDGNYAELKLQASAAPTTYRGGAIRLTRGTADRMGFSVSNTSGYDEKLSILSSGNVGIGTTGPLAKLDVRGTGIVFNVSNTIDQDFRINISDVGAGDKRAFLDMSTNTNIAFGIAGSEKMRIQSNGNVGIGSTSPAYKLDVTGTSQFSQPVIVGTPTANTHATTKTYVDSAMSGALNGTTGYIPKFNGTSSVANSVIYESGNNIGIATTTPSYKFDVDGTAGFRGTTNIIRDNDGVLSLGNGQFIVRGATDTGKQMWITMDTTNNFASINAGKTGVGAYNLALANYGGNVGVGTSSPAYKLDVLGTAQFSQPVIVGTPTANTHAATKTYVDSAMTTKLSLSGGTMTGNVNMNGYNLSSVGKLTVTTIDPLYEIGGEKYSTYASAIVGGVKEEFVGRGQLTLLKSQKSNLKSQINPKCENLNFENPLETRLGDVVGQVGNCGLKIGAAEYQYVIDFNEVKRGSDLWVWRKTVDFSRDNVEVLATPIGTPISIAYSVENNKIVFNAKNEGKIANDVEFSYRLVGKRIDWRDWPTYAEDQSEKASIKIKE